MKPDDISLGRDIARMFDPVLFCRDCGLEPDPIQTRLLTTTSRKVLMNVCRQGGKSTITAIIALYEAIYLPPAMIILVSPSQPQSGELYKKVRGFWQALPAAPEATRETETQLQLSNGSRIVSLPGSEKTVRGFSGATLIIADEASRIPDELFVAVRPMLATTNGRFFGLSTPFGRRGWWYEAWEHGEGWEKIFVKATDCARISPDFLKEELAAHGSLRFSQEYLGAFVDNDTQVFNSDLIQRAIKHDLQPFFASA